MVNVGETYRVADNSPLLAGKLVTARSIGDDGVWVECGDSLTQYSVKPEHLHHRWEVVGVASLMKDAKRLERALALIDECECDHPPLRLDHPADSIGEMLDSLHLSIGRLVAEAAGGES